MFGSANKVKIDPDLLARIKQIAEVAKDLEVKLEKDVPIVKEAEEELKPKATKKLNDLLEED